MEAGYLLGMSTNSNEAFVALSNGNVIKSRSLARVVSASRWDARALNNIKGIPGDLTPVGLEDIGPQIEESLSPHLDADADSRQQADDAEPAVDSSKRQMEWQLRISAKDLRNYGFTDGCRRCADLQSQEPTRFRNHSDECRLRIYLEFKENDDHRWRGVKHLIEPEAPNWVVEGNLAPIWQTQSSNLANSSIWRILAIWQIVQSCNLANEAITCIVKRFPSTG